MKIFLFFNQNLFKKSQDKKQSHSLKFKLLCNNIKNSRDAHTLQPGEIVFNTMRYRRSETVQRSGYFQNSVSYINSKWCLSTENNI